MEAGMRPVFDINAPFDALAILQLICRKQQALTVAMIRRNREQIKGFENPEFWEELFTQMNGTPSSADVASLLEKAAEEGMTMEWWKEEEHEQLKENLQTAAGLSMLLRLIDSKDMEAVAAVLTRTAEEHRMRAAQIRENAELFSKQSELQRGQLSIARRVDLNMEFCELLARAVSYRSE